MLRNGFVIVLAFGMLFGGLLTPARAATPAKVNAAAVAARQAALAQATKKKHRHHHHKKTTALGQVAPAIK